MFVDWLSVRQTFDSIPVFADSLIQRLDHESGLLQWSNYVGTQHRGSYDTSLRVRSDGRILEVSGNPSRWNRKDNVFGVRSVAAAIEVFNQVMVDLGLPEFFDDERTHTAQRLLQSSDTLARDGLTITRVDITQNYATGGPRNSERVLHALRSCRYRGKAPADDSTTLTWGRGSRYLSFKYYLKGPELRAHNKKKCDYVEKLAEWSEEQGLVRFEVTCRSMFLKRKGLDRVGAWTHEGMRAILDDYVLHRRTRVAVGSYMEIRDLLIDEGLTPARAERCQQAALAYMAGHNLREGVSTATFYRLRRDLLIVGIDIAAECDVSSLRFSVSEIPMREACAPDWYEHPDTPARLRLVSR